MWTHYQQYILEQDQCPQVHIAPVLRQPHRTQPGAPWGTPPNMKNAASIDKTANYLVFLNLENV